MIVIEVGVLTVAATGSAYSVVESVVVLLVLFFLVTWVFFRIVWIFPMFQGIAGFFLVVVVTVVGTDDGVAVAGCCLL